MESYTVGGGYKLKKTEISQSAIEARWLFLYSLQESELVNDLLNWVDIKSVPDEYKDEKKLLQLFHYYLGCLTNRKVGSEYPFEWFNTPLNNYLILLDNLKPTINKIKRKQRENWFWDPPYEGYEVPNDIYPISASDKNFRRFLTSDLLENWNSLYALPEAKAFCASLQNWADANNFNAIWCLDLALISLFNFRFYFL